MKKLFAISFLFFSFNLQSQIEVQSSGKIVLNPGNHFSGGLNLNEVQFGGYSLVSLFPNTAWYGVLGTPTKYFGGGYIHHMWSAIYDSWPSDMRAKENVVEMSSMMNEIMKLRPVHYDVKDSFYESLGTETQSEILKDSKNKLGFIAQEMQEVFPEIVHEEPTTGYLGICMVDLIPVLVQGLQEQQKELDSLKAVLNAMKVSGSTEKQSQFLVNKESTLEQNFPNPFNEETTIRYTLAEKVVSAKLLVFDMQGNLLKTYKIIKEGTGEIMINGKELSPGMYLYSLIADGKEIDTKKMILTN